MANKLTSFVFFVITAVIPAFLAEAQKPAPPHPAITADVFVGDYDGTCYRQNDRATGAFRLSLKNGTAGVNGSLQHTGGDPVIARYGPIKFSKGRLEENELVLAHGRNQTRVSSGPNGAIAFSYTNPGGLLICMGSPVGATPR